MKVTVVPAQVTTVEDRIAGSLSLTQLSLLLAPLLLGSVVYVLLPPFFNYAVYKLIAFTGLVATCGGLAVRVRGQLILTWLVRLGRYFWRPRYYVFTKNDQSGRLVTQPVVPDAIATETSEATPETIKPLALAARLQVEQLLNGVHALSYQPNKKGGVNVIIQKVIPKG
ncbi:MAG: hypothetical protein NVS1B10_03610 [Candidatus Saccharimonadales bacterium]